MNAVPASLRDAQLVAFAIRDTKTPAELIELVTKFVTEITDVAVDYWYIGSVPEKFRDIYKEVGGDPSGLLLRLDEFKMKKWLSKKDLEELFRVSLEVVTAVDTCGEIKGTILQMLSEMCGYVGSVAVLSKNANVEKTYRILLSVRDAHISLLKEEEGVKFFRIVNNLSDGKKKSLTK